MNSGGTWRRLAGSTLLMAAILSLGSACGNTSGGRPTIERVGNGTDTSTENRGSEKTDGAGTRCARQAVVGKVQKVALEQRLQMCVWSPGEDISGADLAAAAKSEYALGSFYKAKPMNVNADVKVIENDDSEGRGASKRKKSGGAKDRLFNASVRVLLNFPEGVTEEQAKATRSYIQQSCLQDRVLPLWARAKKGLKVDIHLALESDGALADGAEFHQDLDFIRSPEAGDDDGGARLQLALAYWPYHSYLAPQGHSTCDVKCESKARGSARQNCVQSCLGEINEPFCRSFAKLTTHWLGMEDPMAAKGCQLADGEGHPLKGDVKAGYSKAADENERGWGWRLLKNVGGLDDVLGAVCPSGSRN